MTKEEKLSCFANELASITDKNLKEFVSIVLAGTDDWFYHDPASTSGKYHPKFALGDGGLVRHTRAVVYWVKEIARSEMFNVNARQTELLIAGAIMHDIRKHTATGGYIAKHARAAHDLVIETQAQNSALLSVDEAKYIADAVSTHMGIWGVRDGERKPTSDSEKLLHLADLMASRKEISLDIFETPVQVQVPTPAPAPVVTEVVNPITNPINEAPTGDANTVSGYGSYVITFGRKHPNKTIAEIYEVDVDFLNWIAYKDDFFNKECQENVRKFLESKKQK